MDATYTLTDRSLTLFYEGEVYIATTDHPNWTAAKEALAAKDFGLVRSLIDPKTTWAVYKLTRAMCDNCHREARVFDTSCRYCGAALQ